MYKQANKRGTEVINELLLHLASLKTLILSCT
jgi:hypothetical protein